PQASGVTIPRPVTTTRRIRLLLFNPLWGFAIPGDTRPTCPPQHDATPRCGVTGSTALRQPGRAALGGIEPPPAALAPAAGVQPATSGSTAGPAATLRGEYFGKEETATPA